MAIARTGVYVDDYLEYASTLPAELQRLLNTVRELDDRSQAMINHTRQQTSYYLGLGVSSQILKRGNYEDDEVILRKEIEGSQENVLSLCTEKVLLARQAYDLIDSHVKRLDEDLNNFSEDLKQEGKLPPDEPVILPPLPLVLRNEKRKLPYIAPQQKRLDTKDRDWERDRDFELMPPPGGQKKDYAPIEIDQPIDPNEPTYCVCHQVSFGDMIACDNENFSRMFKIHLCHTYAMIYIYEFTLKTSSLLDVESCGSFSHLCSVLFTYHIGSAKEVNGSIINVSGSHQKQGSEESGTVPPAGNYSTSSIFFPSMFNF